MRRFFAKNLLFVITLNLLIKPAWIFMIDRTVQNKVGHADYGLYQALFNFGVIFQILLDFGLNNYNSGTIAKFPGKLEKLFPAMLSARLLLSLVYILAIGSLGWLIGYRGWQIMLLLGVLGIQLLASVLQFIRSNLSGLHRFKADGIVSITDRFLMILVCGFLLVYPATANNFRIEWFVIAQMACYFTAVVFGLFLLKKISGISFRLSFDYKKVISIIKSSLPYALLIFLMSVYTRADAVLIERLCGKEGSEQAGIYASAYRLLDVCNMFGIMFAGMLIPLFGRMLQNKTDVQPIVQLCVNLLLPFSLLAAVVGIYFHTEIMQLLYKDTTTSSGFIFMWLMLSLPAFSLTNVYSTLLTANGDLKVLNKIAFAGVLVNLLLNVIFIPMQYANAAAITAFITQMIVAAGFILFARKRIDLPVNSKWIFSFFLFLILLLGMGLCLRQLDINWHIQLLLLVVMSMTMMMAFRYISISSAALLFKKQFMEGNSK